MSCIVSALIAMQKQRRERFQICVFTIQKAVHLSAAPIHWRLSQGDIIIIIITIIIIIIIIIIINHHQSSSPQYIIIIITIIIIIIDGQCSVTRGPARRTH